MIVTHPYIRWSVAFLFDFAFDIRHSQSTAQRLWKNLPPRLEDVRRPDIFKKTTPTKNTGCWLVAWLFLFLKTVRLILNSTCATNGNLTEWTAIWSVIMRVISKSENFRKLSKYIWNSLVIFRRIIEISGILIKKIFFVDVVLTGNTT